MCEEEYKDIGKLAPWDYIKVYCCDDNCVCVISVRGKVYSTGHDLAGSLGLYCCDDNCVCVISVRGRV